MLRSTLRALFAPRRLVPTAVVCAGLAAAEIWSGSGVIGAAHSVVMVAAFLLVGPTSWRMLFSGRQTRGWGYAARLLAYAVIGALALLLLGVLVPQSSRMQPTLLTDATGWPVTLVLFWVGGWGLGRDVDLALRLATERERADELERTAAHAQLLALRRHLDPHFLFNTLNAIAEWCREDPVVAERAIMKLSAMLRTIFDATERDRWPLIRELNLVGDLWSLHRTRDPERFEHRLEIGHVDGALVPPLMLLPLAENAMTHGVWRGGRGDVVLTADANDAGIAITIENPGAYAPVEGEHGHGIASVRERLELAYAGRARVEVGPSDTPNRTLARVELPSRGDGMTLRVVVVDDEMVARKRTCRLLSAMPDVELVAACDGADALLARLEEVDVDLVFLDIRMPGLDGIELAAVLGSGGPSIVYVSAYREHALDAFDVGAVDYVLKPVDPQRLRRAVERAREERGGQPPRRLAVHHAGDVVLVDPASVTHCTFDGTLVTIHRCDGAPPLLSDRSLTELGEALPPGFVRVHRRHLVAIAHVARLEPTPSGGYHAVMADGDVVSVSRQAARRLRKQLGIR